jgi:ubiquitin C-terminal hydrolase
MKLQNDISPVIGIEPITNNTFMNCGITLLQDFVNFHNIVFVLFYKSYR